MSARAAAPDAARGATASPARDRSGTRFPEPARPPAPTARNPALPALILVVTITFAMLVLLQEWTESNQLAAAVEAENVLRLQSCNEHIADFFNAVYATLLFVSLDNDIVAMRRDSRDYIQRMFDYQWDSRRLNEINVVERDFRGDARPFMTFEHVPTNSASNLDREQEEFHALRNQIQQFDTQPNLNALLSDELQLSTADEQGRRDQGYVFSVPIRQSQRLVGMAAGMIRAKTVFQILHRGSSHQAALLVNEAGQVRGDEQVNPAMRSWFHDQFASAAVAKFFGSAHRAFAVEKYRAVWTPVQMPTAEKWWLVYLYDPANERHVTLFSGWFGHLLMAGCMVLAGGAIAVLVWSWGGRLEENRRHFLERKQLEWQVQEGSERIQRRIGANLREDLCQRLTGIAAMSTVLTRKLQATHAPEGSLASEITDELQNSLSAARHLADELQQVSVLEYGFVDALRKLVAHAAAQTGMIGHFEANGFRQELDISVATQLFRIAQEAVRNVIQHAHATKLVITLAGGNANPITVEVSDDGVGDARAVNLDPGLGLQVMRYRSDLIGAQLEIRPAPLRGIMVRCSGAVARPGKQTAAPPAEFSARTDA